MKSFHMISKITVVLLIAAACSAAVDVTVAWDPSLSDTSGNPLNETPTYKLFYGTAPGDYTQQIDAGTQTSITVTGLQYETTYYFAAKAFTPTTESTYSEELQWNSPAEPVVLTGITISGPSIVDEGTTAQYSCTASYSDGSTATVTPAWSENSAYATISSAGVLSASEVTADRAVTLTASFGGLSDTHAVTIEDVPPVLTGITISGPSIVDEGTTAQYSCTASYSDGSSTVVTPVWSENSAYATISSAGVLSALNVASDQPVTVTATYNGQTDTHTVTIKVLPPAAPTNIHPADQAMGVERTVELQWTDVADATGYEVWFGESPETMVQVSSLAEVSYYTGLRPPGQTFWWQITATNEAGSASGGPWSFTTLDAQTPEEALGTVNQDWDSSGNAAWFAQTEVTYDGNSAMQSGMIGAGQQSVLETAVIGPGTVSFWWKVSSEANADRLNFYMDGGLQTGISGVATSGDGWVQESFSVGRGTHRLTWKYEKDGAGTAGADAGWLDDVRWQSVSTITYPLSGFDGKWVAFYLWDHTAQIWIPFGQEFEPDEIMIDNIAPERWYWLSVMEYDPGTKTWKAVHGNWINHWDEF